MTLSNKENEEKFTTGNYITLPSSQARKSACIFLSFDQQAFLFLTAYQQLLCSLIWSETHFKY